jgi:PAS domain S-box-containing protein
MSRSAFVEATSPGRRYGLALLLSALALFLTWLLFPIVRQNLFVFFFAAIVASTWYGGMGPGIVVTLVASMAIGYLFAPAASSFEAELMTLINLGVLLLISTLISSLTNSRRQVIQAERAQREQFRVTLASIGDAVIVADATGRVTFLNPVAEAMTGWNAQEAIGADIESVFHIINADTRQRVEGPTRRVLHEGIVVRLANHTILLTKNGAEVPIDDSGAPIRSSDGLIAGVVLVFRDVSERQQAEAARTQLLEHAQAAGTEAEAAKEQVVSILESITDGFLAFDRSWRFTYLNHEGARTLGRSAEDLVNKNLWEEFPELAETSFGRLYKRAMVEGVVLELEDFYPPFNAWFAARAYPSAAGLSLYFRDISERKRAEIEREQLLAREQEARRLAEEAVRLRDEFLSVAAHELKTPLTSLLGNIQLMQRRALRDGDLPEPAQRSLRVANDQAARLNRMVLALLDVSRIEQGQLSIERAPLDLCDLVRRVVDECRLAAEGRSIELICPTGPLMVAGDALRLEQVLQNLIQNAVKYSPAEKPIVVEVELRGARACIAVRDQGMGIPREAVPRLFQRFYRASNAEEQYISGLGIGLYVVKEIVSLHGGEVSVESAEGAGSTFTVCLPLQPETSSAEPVEVT